MNILIGCDSGMHRNYDMPKDYNNTFAKTIDAGRDLCLEAPLRRRSDADVALAYAELYSIPLRVDEFEHLSAPWQYQLLAAKHVAFLRIERIKYG